MTKRFRPDQCPNCNFNKDNFACMNAYGYCLSGESYSKKGNWIGWSEFKGETTKKCNRFCSKVPLVVDENTKGDSKK